MPPSPVSKLYSTEDCKVAALLTDTPGGSFTYDTQIDVPGIRSATMTPQIESKSLRGDNRELDADSTLVAIEISAEHAQISYPALAVLLGGTWDGSNYTRKGDDPLSYFGMGWRTPTGGVSDPAGDVHFYAHKCKITAYTLGTAFEDYQLLSFTARGVYRASDDELWDIAPHETAELVSI